jgi:hypothetical protein
MSPSDPGAFSGHATKELERLLRDPDTPADRRQLISDELGRRYEAELSGATGSAASPPPKERSTPRRGPSPRGPTFRPSEPPLAGGPPPVGPPPGGQAPGGAYPGGPFPGGPSPAGPPPRRPGAGGAHPGGPFPGGPFPGGVPPGVPPPPQRRRHTGRNIALIVLAVLVMSVGYVVWQSTQESGTTPSTGFTCVTDVGNCPLSLSQPVDSPCSCLDDAGIEWPGFVN